MIAWLRYLRSITSEPPRYAGHSALRGLPEFLGWVWILLWAGVMTGLGL